MSGAGKVSGSGDFKKSYRQWRHHVEMVAQRRLIQTEGNTEVYYFLYEGLLQECQRHFATGGPVRGAYSEMEGLVKPWLTLDVLRDSDPEILADVLRRCDKVFQRTGGRPRSINLDRWFRIGLAAALVIGLFLFLFYFDNPYVERIRDMTNDLWLLARGASLVHVLFVVTPVVVLVSIYLVTRTLRH